MKYEENCSLNLLQIHVRLKDCKHASLLFLKTLAPKNEFGECICETEEILINDIP